MSKRVRIGDQPWRAGIAVYILMDGEGGTNVRAPDGSWQPVQELVEMAPSLQLDDDEARGLLEALVRYYQGAEDTRALRKDYDAERARVDKFIDVMTKRIWTLAREEDTT